MIGLLPINDLLMHRRVYNTNGLAPTMLTTNGKEDHTRKIGYKDMGKLRIRKLTEGECMRFMGFERKDTEACREVGLSRANIFHQSGDSIVTTVLVGIFGELFGLDYEKAINDYADKLHGEVI